MRKISSLFRRNLKKLSLLDVAKFYTTESKFGSNGHYLVTKSEMEEFMFNCMVKSGAKIEHARSLSSCLILADYRGHFSHGLNRLDMYVRDVQAGSINSKEEPVIIKDTVAVAYVDGNNLLGPVVGNFSMNLAINKAKEVGIGMVVAKRSNHYGIAGYYSMQAQQQNLIGISACNTSPLAYPTRSKTRTFGTNPITIAAPGNNGDSFVLDMATTTVAFGKVELCNRKGELIPKTWGADKEGLATTDSKKVLNEGALLPLGGEELSGGYKGYGLMFLVEILCGLLADSNYGPNIRTWQQSASEANLGQCFIAINPDNFGPGFSNRLQDLMEHCRLIQPINVDKPVLIAGDPEREEMKKADRNNGISYHFNQITFAENLGFQERN